jgi:uncharacterized protein YecT (DUF1311 family)
MALGISYGEAGRQSSSEGSEMSGSRWIASAAVLACASGLSIASGALGASKLSPPVIHEKFTPLPCTGQPNNRTTLEMEGCAERDILRTDATINKLAKSVFHLLRGDSARRRFIVAERAWLGFRRADCLSVSDLFQGGTEAAVIDAQCTAERNTERVKDLRTFRNDLSRNG